METQSDKLMMIVRLILKNYDLLAGLGEEESTKLIRYIVENYYPEVVVNFPTTAVHRFDRKVLIPKGLFSVVLAQLVEIAKKQMGEDKLKTRELPVFVADSTEPHSSVQVVQYLPVTTAYMQNWQELADRIHVRV